MKLNDVLERGQEAMRPPVSGQVVGVSGLTVWVEGARSAIGDVVEISTKGKRLPAQVVGVSEDRLAHRESRETKSGSPENGFPTFQFRLSDFPISVFLTCRFMTF